ncbi:MAG: hypothetical protein GAK39_03917 [Variovorax sp.]|nr:MAG: hypothetical protein GAK39_03917 [Variovorax sp.]
MPRLSAKSETSVVAPGFSCASGSAGFLRACEGSSKGSCANGSGMGSGVLSTRRGALARIASQSAAVGMAERAAGAGAGTAKGDGVAAGGGVNAGGCAGAKTGAATGAGGRCTGGGTGCGAGTSRGGAACVSPIGSAPAPNRSANTSDTGACGSSASSGAAAGIGDGWVGAGGGIDVGSDAACAPKSGVDAMRELTGADARRELAGSIAGGHAMVGSAAAIDGAARFVAAALAGAASST